MQRQKDAGMGEFGPSHLLVDLRERSRDGLAGYGLTGESFVSRS